MVLITIKMFMLLCWRTFKKSKIIMICSLQADLVQGFGSHQYIDGLVQEKRNSITNAL